MVIRLERLEKVYPESEQTVLTDISVEVKDGEFFVIVGPSGCGKSTLLRMIAGLTPITAGRLLINEQLANKLPPKDRQLSMVFQSYALFPFLSVEANIGFGLKARHQTPAQIAERVNYALGMVNLTDLRTRKPKALSGGQRQRVALARAIASDAKICLMDEPLSNLDAQLRAKMRLELKQLQRKLGLTVIYVTHDQIEAMTMADRVMVLNNRQVQQIDTPLNLYQRPKNQFVASFFGTPQINLLSATVRQQHLLINTDLDFAIERPIADGTEVTVGIRPNQLHFQVTVRNANARIESVAYLGDQVVAMAVLSDDQTIRLVSNDAQPIKVGDLIRITGASELAVFEKDTGNLMLVEKGSELDATVTAR